MKEEVKYDGKWLSLREKILPRTGAPAKRWEFVSRQGCQGVCGVIALKPGAEPCLVLVKQFRPPADGIVLEFPAGLIEPHENAADAALRELAEETGYTGEVVDITPPVYSSAGLTDETVTVVTVQITGRQPRAADPDEEIEVVELPLRHLRARLRQLAATGLKIDAKLWFFAEGREEAEK